MGDYTASRALTLKLLTQKGKPLTLTREESGAVYDPVSGTYSGGTTLNLNGVGVLLNYKASEINGDSVKSTDRKLLFQGDDLMINDKYGDYRVYFASNLDPDESGTILTTAQLRRQQHESDFSMKVTTV